MRNTIVPKGTQVEDTTQNVTVRAENFSELIPATRKIEFESCKYLKKPSDSELSKKNGGIIRPRRIFSKHFGLIHLAGLRVLKHFSKKYVLSSLSSFSLSSSLFFFSPLHTQKRK